MKTQLTKRVVAQAQPRSKPYEIRDILTRGLILRVQPSGHKAWIVTWAHGKRRTLGSVEHLSLEDARAHATQAMTEVVQQGLPALAKARQKACTLQEFLDQHYAPWVATELRRGHRYVQRIAHNFPDFLVRSISDIDPDAINRWWNARLAMKSATGRTVQRVTAHRDFACLRSALSKAVEWKLIDVNPLLGVRQRSVQSRKVVRFLSADEEARLRAMMAARDLAGVQGRANANAARRRYGQPVLPDLQLDGYVDHLTPVVLLAMNTGMRRGELLSMTWGDVDLEAKMLTIRAENAKSGRQRHIPLNVEALDVLQRWAIRTGGQRIGRVFNVNDVKTGWTKLLADARIEQFRFHDLRHHFASRLVRAGVDLNTVRELLGHADITMTLRYAHLAPDTLAAAVAKLAA
ncbi:site-specific integrase [Stenotrophomonas sp.]|uniref:site-specific integrase n=1 Tax=Stenotrophomonas sp. TaxID=69392 RepID=UPI0028B1CA71|nr:site-specific integrase [Stenotrophomonas sp.]